MLSHNSQQQQKTLNSNENRYILHKDRKQYNNYRRESNNRTRTLTAPSQMMMHQNMANRFHHFSHSMPEVLNIHDGNGNFRNQTHQAESIEDAAQRSGEDTLCMAFSKITGSSFSLAKRLKVQSPNLMCMELKRDLFHAIFNNSIQQSCNPGLCSTVTSSR